MSNFPANRGNMKRLEESYDVDKLDHIIARVTDFLMAKALHENRKQDLANPAHLGNVRFWIVYNERSKEARLAFNKHPDMWDVKAILKDTNNQEAEIMQQKMYEHDVSMYDNPFRA